MDALRLVVAVVGSVIGVAGVGIMGGALWLGFAEDRDD